MKIIHWDDFNRDENILELDENGYAASIGVFDGVHLGHQALIERTVKAGKSLLITFSKNPQEILAPESFPGYIFSLQQRLEVFADLGVSLVCLIDFSRQFGTLPGKDFINLIQDRFKLHYLALGGNFRCGYGLDSDSSMVAQFCAELEIDCEIVEPLILGDATISSSRIRNALALGDLVEVQKLSGRDIVFDVAGASVTPGHKFFDYSILPLRRVVPPFGRYEVQYLFNDLSERHGYIDIVDGFLRSRYPNVERVHFIRAKEFF